MAKRPKFPRTSKPAAKERGWDDHLHPDVSERHCMLIGAVIVAWSKLEAVMQSVIWKFLGLHEDDGRIMTGRLDARPKIELLNVLGERYLPEGDLAHRFFEALARSGELAEDRNFIAHGVWATLMTKHVPIAMSLRPKSGPGEVIGETFPEPRMMGILHDTYKAYQAIKAVDDALSSPREQ